MRPHIHKISGIWPVFCAIVLLPECFAAQAAPAATRGSPLPAAVTLSDHGDSVTLANDLVSLTVSKGSGNLTDLRFHDRPLLAQPAYLDWHVANDFHLQKPSYSVSQAPDAGSRELVDIAFRQTWSGAAAEPPVDVDLHYVLRRGDSGPYVYVIYSHPASYPALEMGQTRWVMRMDDKVFDTLSVDDRRTWAMPPSDTPEKSLGPKESMQFTAGPWKGQITDKYHYFVEAGDHFFHGWMGSTSHVGAWIVYGSTEDQNGGPTKQHNSAQWGRLLFKILSCGHYGAAPIDVPAGQAWQKMFGPWMIYLNEGDSTTAMRADAAAKAARERVDWPLRWLENPAYPLSGARGTVSGRIVLHDPALPAQAVAGAWVGLAAPSPDWQQQSLGYQFWVHADADGHFKLPAVRAGAYTLYAWVPGVLGEFRHDGVTVGKGGEVALGYLDWTPKRYGPTAWEIGVPDRTAAEFRHGDDPRHWGLWLEYPKDFPKGVDYEVGKSDWHKDWNYAQVTVVQPDNKYVGTSWRVHFTLKDTPKAGDAVLRLAFAGAHNADLQVLLNDHAIGEKRGLESDNAVARASNHGQYSTWDVSFPASTLHTGENVLTLNQRAGGAPFKNVMYDYLRLELPAK